MTILAKSVTGGNAWECEGSSEQKIADARTVVPFERTVLVLFLIGFVAWLVFAASGYAARHAQLNDGWAVGKTSVVEVSLIPEDRRNLACASDVRIGALRCKFGRDQKLNGSLDERDTLQPWNTVKNELFLGAGLWELAAAANRPPSRRFTVVCNYHVEGVLRSAALRWAPGATFGPLTASVTAGTLTDCAIPP